MAHILPLTQPVSDVGRLYRKYRAGEITLEEYLALVTTCECPGCARPAATVERGQRRCAVCALRERNARRGRP